MAKKSKQSLKSTRSKNRIYALALVCALVAGSIGVYIMGLSSAAKPVNVDVATYNVLGQHHDGKTRLANWSMRKARVSSMISKFNPGIIGMQEVTYRSPFNNRVLGQRSDINKFMTAKGYANYVGSATNNSPLYWKKGTFNVLAKREVKIVGVDSKSKGPAARFLTFVRLKKGGKNISVFNYHFNNFRSIDHQLSQLRKHVNGLKGRGDNVIMTGDFNNFDARVQKTLGLWRVDGSRTIDHVLASSNVARRSWATLTQSTPAASDHRLVGVRVTLR